jgi:predicted ATPase
MSDVFISYARSTAGQANTAAEALRAAGYSVWLDEDLPAHRPYAREIETQLTAARVALVIWSREAVLSEWVLSEANRARRDRKLVQVNVDGAPLPMPFDQIQCADLSGWRGEVAHPGWRKVAASVQELAGAGYAPGATPAADPFAQKRAAEGNLPSQATSFVGREAETSEVVGLVREHRLVTLTGVGGVGKTRLALKIADELSAEFADGAWLVELAPVSDPAAVPDTVAAALGITPQGDRTVAEAIVEALAARRLLVVLDNCEHVLDAAAGLVETLLARTASVMVIATSREGLRLPAEHLWPVPSLSVREGEGSAAVRLFKDRARAVKPLFVLGEGADAEAVTAICQRLDGIALAIELAAARMASMSPAELLARLTDRFRLLSGARRGLERHQTLRQAVQWSFDLLTEQEKQLLGRCSVFAGGYDLAAATAVCGAAPDLDEYAVLDLLDSLVRKSLVNADQATAGTRYTLLETIRQFAEVQLAAAGETETVRDRHARYYAAEVVRQWEEVWPTPRHRAAYDWAEEEFFNLREGFRWVADRGDLDTAAAIAAHAGRLLLLLERYEPAQWAEEILEAATRAEIRQLPRLYVCACIGFWEGRTSNTAAYARKALSLADDPRYDPFAPFWGLGAPGFFLFFCGEVEEPLAIFRRLAAGEGLTRVWGLWLMVWQLTSLGRSDEARKLDETLLEAAQALGHPFFLAAAQWDLARARLDVEPERALSALRSALSLSREHRDVHLERLCRAEFAYLEGVIGDPAQALAGFDALIDSRLRIGDQHDLAVALGYLALLFDRYGRPEAAATLYGASHGVTWVVGLLVWVDRAREALGPERFDACRAAGEAMTFAETAAYARAQIAHALEAPHAAGGARQNADAT